MKFQALLYLGPLNLSINPSHIAYIRQFKGRSKIIYDVEFNSEDMAKAVRTKYGTFWRKRNRPAMPSALQGISISNSLTFATRVRVAILKEIAKRHTESNPGLQCFVTNYLPRPTLKLKSKGITSFGYVEAVKRFGHHLSVPFLTSQTKFAKTNTPIDDLLPTFLVLSPDLLNVGENLDLSLISASEEGADREMDDMGASGSQSVSFSTPPEGPPKKTPLGKGEKRKAANQVKTASKKSATNIF